MICHTLAAFEQSVVNEVVLVVSPGMEEYAKNDILGKFSFSKVRDIVTGGRQRSDSVYAGICDLYKKIQKKDWEDAVNKLNRSAGYYPGSFPFRSIKALAIIISSGVVSFIL